MLLTSSCKFHAESNSKYDRGSKLMSFDDSKTGVKGLVDSRAAKVPRIFINEKVTSGEKSGSEDCKLTIPTIDFQGIDKDASIRSRIIDKSKTLLRNGVSFR